MQNDQHSLLTGEVKNFESNEDQAGEAPYISKVYMSYASKAVSLFAGIPDRRNAWSGDMQIIAGKQADMREILNAVQTARIIGCDPHKVRERLKCGIWTFGEYIPAERTGKKQDCYEINAYSLAGWLRISMEELEKRVKK